MNKKKQPSALIWGGLFNFVWVIALIVAIFAPFHYSVSIGIGLIVLLFGIAFLIWLDNKNMSR